MKKKLKFKYIAEFPATEEVFGFIYFGKRTFIFTSEGIYQLRKGRIKKITKDKEYAN